MAAFPRHTKGSKRYTLCSYTNMYNELAVLTVSFLSIACSNFLSGHLTVYTSFVVQRCKLMYCPVYRSCLIRI